MPRRWLPLVAVWLASAAYVGARLERGWVPLDEGTLAHAAERVQHGELPHRDFDDVYTGGLARFDAVVFDVVGTRLTSLRLALYAAFLLWVPIVYYIATRFAEPVIAAGVTALCVVWSLPTNPSAMPSWYNLFLATAGTAALCRFTETRRKGWLFAAGVAGGLSVIVKIVGLFYLAAAALFLAYDEHLTAVPRAPAPASAGGRPTGYAALVSVAAVAFAGALIALVRSIPRASRFIHFVLPGAALAAVLAGIEWRDRIAIPWPARVRQLAALAWPVALGAAIPIALFLVPYIASGSVAALVHGVFVQPARRYQFAVVPPASLGTIGAALPWLLVFTSPRMRKATPRDIALLVAVGEALALLLLFSLKGGIPYALIWLAICYVAPCAVLAGSWVIATAPGGGPARTRLRQEQLWLLICMTAMCSLIQVPVASWGYILYFAPIAILAILAVVTTRPASAGARPALVGAFFLAFGLLAVNPYHVAPWRGAAIPPEAWPRVPLSIPRTGLRVGAADADTYARVVALLRDHTPGDGFIYAAPDCPELYFLAQRRNPTRTLFDFLDDTAGRDARLLRDIEAHRVAAIAINRAPEFSPPIDSTLALALRTRFPDSAAVGDFVVRWRTMP